MPKVRTFDPNPKAAAEPIGVSFLPLDPEGVQDVSVLLPPPSMLEGPIEPVWIDLFGSIFLGTLGKWHVEPKPGIDSVLAGLHVLGIINAPNLGLRQKERVCSVLLREWFVSVRRV